MSRKMIFYACASCGSDDVRLDAHAVWDLDEQQWVLSHTFAQAYCERCRSEVTIKRCSVAVPAGSVTPNVD